jgi:hypothetical protein
MLAYILALLVGLGTFALYMAAFFFPEVHRKEDFYWSIAGFFYALVLWVCAGRITGGVLLGQMASVALIGWFGWQTLSLRQKLALPEDKTKISPDIEQKLTGFSIAGLGQKLLQSVTNVFKKSQPVKGSPSTPKTTSETATVPPPPPPEESTETAAVSQPISSEASTSVEAETPDTTETEATEYRTPDVTIIDNRPPAVEETAEQTSVPETPTEEAIPPNPPTPEQIEDAQTEDKSDRPKTPIEEIAPDAELAPPAEPPGAGDPQMRQNPPE